MGDTSIEWTDKTWNPVRGCSRVSEGCRNCYAERVAGRFSGPGQPYEGLVTVSSRHPQTGAATTGVRPKWTGEVRFVPEHLADPLRWRKPRRVFVNSMSDLFHEKLSDQDIEGVFAVMALAQRHTFQILTKRPERMRDWFSSRTGPRAMNVRGRAFTDHGRDSCTTWPLPNVWLGVSVEDQGTADERIPLLLDTPAAVRFVSYEPALGPVDFRSYLGACNCSVECEEGAGMHAGSCPATRPRIDWVIAGSESGPGARPAELQWFRDARDQCAAAGVSFFFKQWVGDKYSAGEVARDRIERRGRVKVSLPVLDGRQHMEWPRTLTLEDTLPMRTT